MKDSAGADAWHDLAYGPIADGYLMTFVFWPDHEPTGIHLGGKALSLWTLRHSDLAIPSWFVVLPEAFDDSLPEDLRLRLQSDKVEADLDPFLASLWPSPTVAAELNAALARLCPEGEAVAVRSSACDEDGRHASFAGQLESFLAVPGAEVAERVAAVWRSGFTSRVRAYRAQHELAPVTGAPAVLVQRMVQADVSGVAFGADPVSGRRDRLVVAAVPGLGQGLVNGDCDADTWQVDRAGMVLTRRLTVKSDAWRATPDGMRREPLAPGRAADPVLRDDQIALVAAAAATAGRHFGAPQDIEWAIEGGRLYLLQSRPITTLPPRPADDEPLAIWDNSNIVESYSGVTTPLTFSFAQRAYEGVYRQFCRLLSVPSARIASSDTVFRNMLGLHRGRIYYNLLNWYRVLAMLPGFTLNRRFMEQMMGVKEPMPAEFIASLETNGFQARVKDGLDVARSISALVFRQCLLPRTIRRFRVRLEDALRPPSEPFESMSCGALTAAFQDLEQRLLRRWDAPLLNDFFTMIFYGVLRDVTAKWSGDATAMLHNDLLCDGGGMVSAEPARRIAELAQLVVDDAGLSERLCRGSRPVIEQAIDGKPAFRAASDAYLSRFGDRCFDELKLESPTLTDDPLPLYRAIGRMASMRPLAPQGDKPCSAPPPRAAAEARMNQALSGRPIRRLLFRWILSQARNGVRERENLRLERTRLFGRVRRIILALGHRLHELDALDHPRDVFYLQVDDILQFVSGATATVRLRELAALRRAEFAAHDQAPPLPNRFTTRGIPCRHLPEAEAPQSRTEGTGGDQRSGIGCCPGVVRGRVCVVTDPARSTIRPGEILVAERTDPGWIMLFPGAAGLLVERGSLLSHSAIVARELRLPAVVAVSGLMAWLRDGDEVEFDGSSGVVRRLPPVDARTALPPLIQSITSTE